jgi:hypothetical protein
MILTPTQIDNNIRWLLQNATPPVRYLTHRYLLRTPPESETIDSLWQEVETCPEVAEIFGKQEADGSWCCGGSWAQKPSYSPGDGNDPYTPKYATTVWVLPILAEMGFSAEMGSTQDARIRKACQFVLEHGYFLDPYFTESAVPAEKTQISPCRFSQYLIALGSVGYEYDPRLDRGYEYLLSRQRADGGWALQQHYEERHWTRSCPWSTYHAATALYFKREKDSQAALTHALTFLVSNLSVKSSNELCRFFFHGHSTVRELLMFSETKIGLNEPAIQTILQWLMTMYQPEEGFFRYGGKAINQYSNRSDGMDARVARYRLHHLIESDWLTFHMTRIGMNLLA